MDASDGITAISWFNPESEKERVFQLCNIVRETAFAIHGYLRHGHLEKVDENALVHRLRGMGVRTEQQAPMVVRDEDGTILGEYFADVLVEGTVLVELKACKALDTEHTAQILGYLRSTGVEHGLLINFGAPKLQVRKLVFTDAAAKRKAPPQESTEDARSCEGRSCP